jgi:hypothetical protein
MLSGCEEEMNMIKKFLTVLISIVLSLGMIAGCASSDKTEVRTDTDSNFAQSPGDVAKPTADEAGSFAPDVDPGSAEPSGKKIIYTANISIEVSDVRASIEQISDAVASLGGYVAGSNFNDRDDRVSGSITVRIPPGKLDEISDRIEDMGKVLTNNLSSQDVTYDYVDLDARLKNAQAQEKQLLAIMEQATLIEDILAVRSELGRVQQEIEVLKGQLRYLDNMVDFSTVTVALTQTYVPKSPEADADEGLLARWDLSYIGTGISKGFRNSLTFVVNAFGFLFILISNILVPLLIFGAIVFAIVFIVKRIRKRFGKVSKKASPRGYTPPTIQAPSIGQPSPDGPVSPTVSAPPKKDGK